MTPCIPKDLTVQKLSFLTQDKKTQRCKLEETAFPSKVNLCLNMLVIHQSLVTAFDESPLKSNIRGCFFDRFTGTKLSVVWPISRHIGFYFLQCIPRQYSHPTKRSISVWMPFISLVVADSLNALMHLLCEKGGIGPVRRNQSLSFPHCFEAKALFTLHSCSLQRMPKRQRTGRQWV